MRPIRSLFVFAAGATAATPRGRAVARRAFAIARKARQKHHTWHEVPPPGESKANPPAERGSSG